MAMINLLARYVNRRGEVVSRGGEEDNWRVSAARRVGEPTTRRPDAPAANKNEKSEVTVSRRVVKRG